MSYEAQRYIGRFGTMVVFFTWGRRSESWARIRLANY